MFNVAAMFINGFTATKVQRQKFHQVYRRLECLQDHTDTYSGESRNCGTSSCLPKSAYADFCPLSAYLICLL